MNAPVITSTTPLNTKEMEEIAERIRARIRRTAEDIIAVGADLARVKAQLGHGKFLDWIDREFGMSERSARNYMSVAAWAEGKSATVADLAPSTLYLLASPSTPEDIEKGVIADIESGKPVDTKRVKTRIEEAKATTATTTAVGDVDEQGEVAQGGPKPARDKKRRRTQEEILRDNFFDGRLPTIEGAAGVSSELPVPKLNAEDARRAIKQIRKAEACLRQLRREIEKQHPKTAGEVVSLTVEEQDSDEDDDPLAIPPWLKRGCQS